MKFWIRIIVALSVVLVIAFGVWAFFFREKDNVVAFNRTCEIIDYKNSIDLNESLNTIRSLTYIKKDESKTIIGNTDVKKEILQIREDMLSLNIIETYDANGERTCYFDSYYVLDGYVDEMIKNILPFLQNANINDATNRSIKKSINNYKNDLSNVKDALNVLIDRQNLTDNTDIEYEMLLGNYKSTRNKYKQCLNDGAELIKLMIQGIRENYGTLKFDTKLALMDSFARSLSVCTKIEILREPYFAHDVHLVLDKYNKFNNKENIFTSEYTEYKFLQSYNDLINNFNGVLDSVYSKHYIEKTQMADNTNLSGIRNDAQAPLVVVLNVIGY